ncbi:MAG: hemerythrin domain-containing protein [Acidobacteria bacterium]|nr:hemerythrin domain-containing protein [Acidobacteriota bacterium]
MNVSRSDALVRRLGDHSELDALARDLKDSLKGLGEGSPQVAPEVAALALRLNDKLSSHLRSEEDVLFHALERIRAMGSEVRSLRSEHEVLRLQSVGVRHLAARAADEGAQAAAAVALLGPLADSFLETLGRHACREEEVVFPSAAQILGEDRFAALVEEMDAVERREQSRAGRG